MAESQPTTTKRAAGAGPDAQGPAGFSMADVERYVADERRRSRRVVVWTGSMLLCVFLFFFIIFISIGIYSVKSRRQHEAAMADFEQKTQAMRAQFGMVSNRVVAIENVQRDIARFMEALEQSENSRTRELDALLVDVEKIRGWAARVDDKHEASLSDIDARLQEADARAQLEIDATRKELADLIRAADNADNRGDAAASAGALADASRPDDHADPLGDLMLEDPAALTAGQLTRAGVFDIDVDEPPVPGMERREIMVITFPNGDRYEGEMRDGLMHGWGIYAARLGSRYDGQFVDGMKTGRGTLVEANGDKYVGHFANDMKSGRGSLVYANGDRYVGDFINDMRSGKGTMLFANGMKYAGDFKNGLQDGVGMLRFATGDIYRGEIREGVRTGKGAYYFVDGSRYIGEFVGGRRHGQGRYIYASGEEYVGAFRDGQRHGNGTSILPNGKQFNGLWELDKLIQKLP
ncbi:MAG: hypothetical protein O3A51_03635 [Verrucomicrobia bacterium]|nr:hypothetical protein [Verrucomicrobiota bacterium]